MSDEGLCVSGGRASIMKVLLLVALTLAAAEIPSQVRLTVVSRGKGRKNQGISLAWWLLCVCVCVDGTKTIDISYKRRLWP